ncbi:hypothetical protein KKG66_07115, partial [bacterium]|nr:hypothetical protein [bacterium]
IESKLEFSFSRASEIQHVENGEFGHGLKNVDFLIREIDEVILLEVKGTSQEVTRYLSDDIVNQLVEKARDTYTYLHLIQDTAKQLTYIALIDFRTKEIDSAMLLRRSDALKAGLRGEKGHSWQIEYIQRAFLVDVENFKKEFPNFEVNRVD